VWLHFPRIIERIKERGNYVVDEYSLRIEQGELDGKVQYRVHEPIKIGPEGDILWEIKTYSTDVGYNMISSKRTHTDGQLVNQRSIEYNSVQGVYFPKRIIYEVFDYNDGSLRSRKERTFKNIRLNAVIPPEKFTYKNLSLTNGDVFIDKILEKEYTYQEGKLIEVEK